MEQRLVCTSYIAHRPIITINFKRNLHNSFSSHYWHFFRSRLTTYTIPCFLLLLLMCKYKWIAAPIHFSSFRPYLIATLFSLLPSMAATVNRCVGWKKRTDTDPRLSVNRNEYHQWAHTPSSRFCTRTSSLLLYIFSVFFGEVCGITFHSAEVLRNVTFFPAIFLSVQLMRARATHIRRL